MMQKSKSGYIRFAGMILTAVLIISMVIPAMAADDYTYKITVYAGNYGTFAGGKTEITKTVSPGSDITINLDEGEFKLTLTNNKYLVRGMNRTGHDSSEAQLFHSLTIKNVGEDQSFVVSYSVAGNIVRYTVYYVDEQGQELRSSETFYGVPGDKPVVSYRYVEGYLPNAYNEAKTLSQNESENVFRFVYRRINSDVAETTSPENEATTASEGETTTAAEQNAAGAAGNAQTQGAAGTANGNGADPAEPDELLDLDDNEVPLAGPGGSGNSSNGNGGSAPGAADNNPASQTVRKGLPAIAWIGICIGGAAMIAALIIILLIIFRRKNTEH